MEAENLARTSLIRQLLSVLKRDTQHINMILKQSSVFNVAAQDRGRKRARAPECECGSGRSRSLRLQARYRPHSPVWRPTLLRRLPSSGHMKVPEACCTGSVAIRVDSGASSLDGRGRSTMERDEVRGSERLRLRRGFESLLWFMYMYDEGRVCINNSRSTLVLKPCTTKYGK